MRIEIRELVEILGKELAHSDDEMQGKFFNAFASELIISVRGRGNDIDNQLCYLTDKLTSDGADVIISLAEFIKLRRQHPIHSIDQKQS